MGRLLLLFIVIPAIELALLIEIGSRIGTLTTLAVIVITGVVGAFLARRQGMGVLKRMQTEVAAGGLPAGSIIDGVIILVAGALLMTPGFLTDIFGFLCLIPGTRNVMKRALRRRVERAVKKGHVNVYVASPGDELIHRDSD